MTTFARAALSLIACGAVLAPVFVSAKTVDRTPPALASVHIQSSGASAAVARPGDTVTISFTATEKVIPVVLVTSRMFFAKVANTAGNSWEARYVVSPRDKQEKAEYLITLVDASKNVLVCASVRLPLIGYCPPTDGSSVVITREPVPAPDTVAPVIAAHADVHATTSEQTGVDVAYALPTAVDAVDGAVAVSCTPAPSSFFAVGTTTVTCSARDAAGNAASSMFAVGVTYIAPPPVTPPGPTIVTLASQPDDSFLCADSWSCMPDNGLGQAVIQLGPGSALGSTLTSATIARDESYASIPPWTLSVVCFSDAAYANHCGDWGPNQFIVSAQATTTADGKHWTAYFSPQALRPGYYYEFMIENNGWDIPAYGSQSLGKPYFVLSGVQ